MNKQHLQLAFILTSTFTYAILRYVVYGHVSLTHIPAFLLNKTLAFSAVIALLLSSYSLLKSAQVHIKFWVQASLHLSIIHILISLALMSSRQYPELFEFGETNLKGELLILFGSLAAYGYWVIHKIQNRYVLHLACIIVSTLITLHLICLGLGTWLNWQQWLITLPAISFLSFSVSLLTLGLYVKTLPIKH